MGIGGHCTGTAHLPSHPDSHYTEKQTVTSHSPRGSTWDPCTAWECKTLKMWAGVPDPPPRAVTLYHFRSVLSFLSRSSQTGKRSSGACVASTGNGAQKAISTESFYVTNNWTKINTFHLVLSTLKRKVQTAVHRKITFAHLLITYPMSFALKWKCGCHNPLL